MPCGCGKYINNSEAYGCFGHKCVAGPDTHVLTASVLLILVPGTVCFAYTSASWVASIIGAVLLVVTLYFLIRTGTTDPGYLPKQAPPPDVEIPKDRNTTEIVRVERRKGQFVDVKVDRRWCYTCHLLRPPRASHCAYCNACVERMDHHCPWTGTCVGRRNYRYFVFFVWSTSILCVFVIGLCIYGLVVRTQEYNRGPDPEDGMAKESGVHAVLEGQRSVGFTDIVFLIYGLIFLCMVGGLAGYHTYLSCSNLTTHEEMKHYYSEDAGSPFDQGPLGNLKEVFCIRKGPSRVAAIARENARGGGGGGGLGGADGSPTGEDIPMRDRVHHDDGVGTTAVGYDDGGGSGGTGGGGAGRRREEGIPYTMGSPSVPPPPHHHASYGHGYDHTNASVVHVSESGSPSPTLTE